MYPFDKKEALDEVKFFLDDLTNPEELAEFFSDYKIKSKKEFLKMSDEKKLRKFAKDNFHMK
jgi:hypothetical protein